MALRSAVELRPSATSSSVPAVRRAGARVHNPAFDVTPARLVTALITERGVIRAPGPEAIPALRR